MFSFIHIFISGYLGSFHLLAVVTDAAVNMGVQLFFRDLAFSSVAYIPRSIMTRSYMLVVFLIFEETPYSFL